MAVSLRRSLLVPLLLLAVVPTAQAATPTATQRCIAGKRSLVGKAIAALTRCDAAAVKKGVVVDSSCIGDATARFENGWNDLEASYTAGDCYQTGDIATLGPMLDAERASLETLLGLSGAASSCTSLEFRAAGKASSCALRCAYKAALKGLASDDPDLVACESKCDAQLSKKLAQAEKSDDCHTTGDAAAVAANVDGFVADVIGQIPPPLVISCALPGSVRFTSEGAVTVPGGDPSWPSLAFLHLPNGFCAHYYATVPNARQLRFAPGGELFVASPTRSTTGGGPNGRAAIVVVPDDNGDGVGDTSMNFLGSLPATQGLMFANDHLYYQDDQEIRRIPYATGDRSPSSASELVATIDHYVSALHWPKTFDIADDGTIYASNGGDQYEACEQPMPFHGGILKLDSPNGTPVAGGFRNPIVVRCQRGHDNCFALELAKDYTASVGGREKLITIHDGDDWGFPCCAATDTPYAGLSPVPDCSGVESENAGFLIGDTPFGLDFAPATWPSPYSGSALISLHGAYGNWSGARMVAITVDPMTGLPIRGSGPLGQGGTMTDFATGWDDATLSHGRPADVFFSPDGRLFVANDNNGVIFWIRPID